MGNDCTRIDGLPSVAGDRLLTTIREFSRRTLVLLEEEQRKPSPDNALVGHLCETVRFTREHIDYVRNYLAAASPSETPAPPTLEFQKDDFSQRIPLGTHSLPEGSAPMTTENDDAFTQSFDGLVWAEAFVKRVRAGVIDPREAGDVHGWFANAIMRGYDEARRGTERAEAAEAEITRLRSV